MRGCLASGVRSQEREQARGDSWELPFPASLVCGRLARLGERGRLDRRLEAAAKLQEAVEEAVPGATSTSETGEVTGIAQ